MSKREGDKFFPKAFFSVIFLLVCFTTIQAQEMAAFPKRLAFAPGEAETLVFTGMGTYGTITIREAGDFSFTTNAKGKLVKAAGPTKEKVRTDRYDIALYLDEEGARAAFQPFQGKEFFDLLPNEKIHQAVLGGDFRKAIMIRFTADQTAVDIRKDFAEQLGKSLPLSEEAVVGFIKYIKADFKKGDEILIRVDGKSKAMISVCGSDCGEIQKPEFIQALLSIWIGMNKMSSKSLGLLAEAEPLFKPLGAASDPVFERFVSSFFSNAWIEDHFVELRTRDVSSMITFNVSPDSRRVADIDTINGKRVVVVNGKEGKGYDEIWDLVFSPDSQHVAYAAKMGMKLFTVVDGKEEEKQYDGIAGLIFSPDGKRVAYGANVGKKWFAVVDGKEEEKQYDGIGGLAFSPDSMRVVYGAKTGKKWFAVVDGKKEKEYERSTLLIFSSDSQHVAYAAQIGKKWLAVVDGKEEEKQYDGIAGLILSPDGKRMAYGANIGKKWFAVVDSKEEKQYDGIGRLIFSPDSMQVAYGARIGKKWFAVVDSKEEKQYDGIGDLIFSPDGKRMAYGANVGKKWFAVVDGKEEKQYDALGGDWLAFSPDSMQVAYGAKIGKKWFAVVNGKEGKQYDILVFIRGGRIVFDSPESFHYLAIKFGTGILLVEEKIKKD